MNSSKYLDSAREIATWLGRGEDGAWREHDSAEAEVKLDYGAGIAGVVTFYLALHQATGDAVDLQAAQRGGEALLEALPRTFDEWKERPGAGSLYGGYPGLSWALFKLFQETGDDRYRAAAVLCFEELLKLAESGDERFAGWNPYNDVLSGLAGTGLFLLYANSEMGDEASLSLARTVGEILLERAVEKDSGMDWLISTEQEFSLPNFSHGTAGVAMFLAALYKVTGEKRFLDAALAGAAYLESIARQDDGLLLVPYGLPDIGWDRPYDIGWAHGPAGTYRLFRLLAAITGDQKWQDHSQRCIHSLKDIRGFESPSPLFGKAPFSFDRRFGLAGVGSALVDSYRRTRSTETLAQAELLAESILSRSELVDGARFWSLERYGFMGNEGELSRFTGYFYGAAGIGLFLLELDAAMTQREWTIFYPDEPESILR